MEIKLRILKLVLYYSSLGREFTFHGENGKLETCAVPRTWVMAQRRKIIICGYGLTGTGKAFWKKVATKILTSCEFGRDYFTCLRESGGLM